jgi:hypothetical protein
MVAGIFFGLKRPFLFFLAFISIGLANDLFISFMPNILLANLSMSVYSLLDILFLLWFTLLVHKPNPRISIVISLLVFIFWFVSYKMHNPLQATYSEGSSYFDPIMLAVVGLVSAYGLITITESPKKSENQKFLWFYLGIFFYNFSSFFLHSFISDEVAKQIWFMNALFNIIAMLIYTWAFVRLYFLNAKPIAEHISVHPHS